ncbi:hypothetical protein [Extensimonas sp. H3M7-6]|jgi:hypothetical protein|uniref:hypothetical protein n=1 Tax=Extensimonas soli TaxID=3031322 RepID=UPI0023DBB33B|nr:hypothetical protein [Extensimonas sp. H3M7-6]MDF1482939.1 hypothetical protein [Extensimonas sp. H3M7-6]
MVSSVGVAAEVSDGGLLGALSDMSIFYGWNNVHRDGAQAADFKAGFKAGAKRFRKAV